MPILRWSMAFVGSLAPGSFSQFYCHPVYVKKKPLTETQGLLGGGSPPHSPPPPPLRKTLPPFVQSSNNRDTLRNRLGGACDFGRKLFRGNQSMGGGGLGSTISHGMEQNGVPYTHWGVLKFLFILSIGQVRDLGLSCSIFVLLTAYWGGGGVVRRRCPLFQSLQTNPNWTMLLFHTNQLLGVPRR